jgi:hypothetical protein
LAQTNALPVVPHSGRRLKATLGDLAFGPYLARRGRRASPYRPPAAQRITHDRRALVRIQARRQASATPWADLPISREATSGPVFAEPAIGDLAPGMELLGREPGTARQDRASVRARPEVHPGEAAARSSAVQQPHQCWSWRKSAQKPLSLCRIDGGRSLTLHLKKSRSGREDGAVV